MRNYWLRPTPASPVSGPYTEDEARSRFAAGSVMWPGQQACTGPDKRRLTLVDTSTWNLSPPEPGQHVRFLTDPGMRTGIVQRVWGIKAVNVTVKTDDEMPGQTFVRLSCDVEIIQY
jgi:hypothetical protein